MNISGRILTSAIALGVAFQPTTVIVSCAGEDNKEVEIIRWYYNGDDGYCELEVDPDSNEVTLPSEPNDKKTEIFDIRNQPCGCIYTGCHSFVLKNTWIFDLRIFDHFCNSILHQIILFIFHKIYINMRYSRFFYR